MQVWAAALLVLSAAGGSGDDRFCDDLGRVIGAAAETPPFASLPGFDRETGASMFGFDERCGRSEDGQSRLFVCSRQLPPETLRVDVLADRIGRCLPTADRVPEPGGGGM